MSVFQMLWASRWKLIYRLKYRSNKVDYLRSIGVKIGEKCDIYTTINDFGTEPWLIEIGNFVTIAGGVRFLNHDGASRLFRSNFENMNLFGNRFGKIHIHDNCFVGHSSILLPDVEIGPNSIIGAGSVVTKSVPPESVAAGNPARVLFTLKEYIARYRAKMLPLTCRNREELRREVTLKIWGEER